MADIVNLRHARKARIRKEAEILAEANRLKHGRTKADKRLTELSRQRQDVVLDGARRENVEDNS